MVISLIRRVKILPRLASSAPFLCLIVAHLLWPDIRYLAWILRCWRPRFEPLYGRTGLRRAQETTKDYSSGRARIPNLVPIADLGSPRAAPSILEVPADACGDRCRALPAAAGRVELPK